MSAAATALRTYLQGLLPDWAMQFGRWIDQGPTRRHAVLKPAGGAPAVHVREPKFTLSLIGSAGDIEATSSVADALVAALRANSAGLVYVSPSEPVYMPTSDGRPVFEIALSAITT